MKSIGALTRLSTRLAIAMVSLVVLTAAAVGFLSYHNVEATILPAAITRLDTRARSEADGFDKYIRSARSDILASAGPASLDGFVRAHAAGGIDPVDGTPESVWRDRMAKNFAAQLTVKKDYAQFRLIDIANHGRDLIRVDRSGPEGTIRVVPDNELQAKRDDDYFEKASVLRAGEVYFSPIELQLENGVVKTPHEPVIHIATPLQAPDGTPLAVLAMNIDLRPAFAGFLQFPVRRGRMFIVNDKGDYLRHPDENRTFGSELGHEYRLQMDFPALAELVGSAEPAVREVSDATGEKFLAAVAPIRLAGGPLIAVIETLPIDVALSSVAEVRRSTLYAGLASVLVATFLAFLLARSLTRPLAQMANSLANFDGEKSVAMPSRAAGEIGVLARTFERMAATIRDRTSALKREIEERSRAQAELVDGLQQTQVIVDNVIDGIIAIDERGVISAYNKAAERIFGYEPAEVQGRNVSVLLPEPDGYLRNYLNGYEPEAIGIRRELTGRRKDGSLFPIEWAVTAIMRSGRREFINLVRDISQRRKAESALAAREAAEAASRAKSEFLASMSHELRTPLNGIIGFCDLLLEGCPPDQQKRYLKLQRAAGEVLLSVINDLLDFSKIEAGKLETESVVFSLRGVVDTCRDIVAGEAARRGLEFATEVAPGIHELLVGDPVRLRQIILNLLTNAIKFTANGRVVMRVTCVKETPNALGLRFAVEDTGIGIPSDKLDRLFQRFSQVDNSTARRFGGSGLGLAICKGLVEAMGGTIGVESTEGKGSLFWFELTLARSAVPTATAKEGAMKSSVRPSRRILIAEDVEMNQILLTEILRHAGHSSTIVSNGVEAVEAIRRNRDQFDLILMDMQMPELDGMAATRIIRGAELSGRRIPIVALTANAFRGDIKKCLESGMDAHIAKPLDQAALLDMIDQMTDTVPHVVGSDCIPARMDGHTSVVDQAICIGLRRQLGAPLVAHLLVLFRQSLAEYIPVFANPDSDAESILEHAHALISQSGSLGFVELAAQCRRVMKTNHSTDSAVVKAAVAELHGAAVRAEIVAQYLQETPTDPRASIAS